MGKQFQAIFSNGIMNCFTRNLNVDALVPIKTSRILSVWVSVTSMRLTVKIAYADKIWLATYGHILLLYILALYRTQCTLYKYMCSFAYSSCDVFLFSRSYSFRLFRYDSKIDDEVHSRYSSTRIRLQTWVHQTADVMCGMLLLCINVFRTALVWFSLVVVVFQAADLTDTG